MKVEFQKISEKEHNIFVKFFCKYLQEIDPEFEKKKYLIDKYCKLAITSTKYSPNWILYKTTRVGFIIWYLYEIYKGRKGLHIAEFYILEEYRRKKIGTVAFQKILNKFDVEEIRLEVVSKNKIALSFWKNLGFKTYKFIMKKTRELV